MNVDERKHVVILDPGLREFGGHHPAMIEALGCSSVIVQKELKITVYANQDCGENLQVKLSKNEIDIIPYFKSDFYRYFYSKEKLSFFNLYIKTLANEYYQAMCVFEYKAVDFLYHTLNWEHASALYLAIGLYQKRGGKNHQHLVCLMYNPSSTDDYGDIDKSRYLKFHLGFSALSKLSNVSLYAAEYELTKNYQAMLGQAIGWHPCGLLSAQYIEEINVNKNKKNGILLYIGDAKQNKGFLALPSLLEQLMETISDPNSEFIIQYTITNDSKELADADAALLKLQSKDRRVVLYRHFLSAEEMHQLWLNTAYIVFNYGESAYRYQSSGVLWLAAAYKVNLYLMTDTWLNREAKRLGCNYYECKNIKQLVQCVSDNIKYVEHKNIEMHDGSEYSQRLFSDLGEWLVEKLTTARGR
nr:hypothetical protein [uncultured Amphritea sp.]